MTASNASSDVLDCGRTIQELSEYLEAGRSPRDPEIEQCPECLNALESLSRVGDLSRDLFAADAASLPEPSAGWFGGILDQVAAELRSGRDLPVRHPDPRVRITVAEGAVRTLLRSAADELDGVFIGRTRIIGDVEELGAPVTIDITASVAWDLDARAVADDVRRRVAEVVERHTDLEVAAIDVTIEDVHAPQPRKDAS